jgi:hypothetical protein
VAATVLSLFLTGCSNANVDQPESAVPPTNSPTHATTDQGFLLPPGYDADSISGTTAAPTVLFDSRTDCDPAASDLDVLRMQSLVASYNQRDEVALNELLETAEIYDATAVPYLGSAEVTDVLEWARAGWAVGDQLKLVLVQSYSGTGADGTLERSNEVMERVGIDRLVFPFKAQATGCSISRFVAYRPVGDDCSFYKEFHSELVTAEVVIPESCA